MLLFFVMGRISILLQYNLLLAITHITCQMNIFIFLPFEGGTSFVNLLCFFLSCFTSLCARLFIFALFRLKDLSIDEMVGARCFGCFSGPPGFTCLISFARVFSFIYC